jgi:two-component system, OmpR family, response regulator
MISLPKERLVPYNVLVVDDEPHIRDVICFALANAGMNALTAADGLAALEKIKAETVDLVVLDIGLPELDGLEVCRRIRKMGDVPIIFLSARSEEIDRVVGLEIGGDDYVVKPFSARELMARIAVILKRPRVAAALKREDDGSAIECGPLRLDMARFKAAYGGRDVALTPNEFTILRALASKPGIVLNRNRIVALAYAHNVNVSDRTIDSHVRNIRAKLGAVGGGDLIETVHRVGFRLSAFTEPAE